MKMLFRFIRDETAATSSEYGLIAGLIGVVIVTAVTATGTAISGKFNKVSSGLA